MGVLDAVFLRAPGVLAKGLRGRMAGEELARKRAMETAAEDRASQGLGLQQRQMALQESLLPEQIETYRRQRIAQERAADAALLRALASPPPTRGIVVEDDTGQEIIDPTKIGQRLGPKPRTAPTPPRDRLALSTMVQPDGSVKRVIVNLDTNEERETGITVPSKPTSTEESSQFQLPVVEQSYRDLTALQQAGKFPTHKDALIFQAAPERGNILLSAVGRQYYDNLKPIIMSYGFAISGKQIPPDEFRRLISETAPRLGDDPGTLRQKQDRLDDMRDAIRTAAGRAQQRQTGVSPDDQTARAWIKTYREKPVP